MALGSARPVSGSQLRFQMLERVPLVAGKPRASTEGSGMTMTIHRLQWALIGATAAGLAAISLVGYWAG